MKSIEDFKGLLPPGVRRPLGRLQRELRSRPAITDRQKYELTKDPSLSISDREFLEKISARITADDGMYKGDGSHYFKVGLSAVECIEAALKSANLERIDTILDLPCGGGRVLRFLRGLFPDARIVASDIHRGNVDFCARTFAAIPAYSIENLDALNLEHRFDLIWCGSLVTHLNARSIGALFRFMERHLNPEGLAVLTTHGAHVVDRMQGRVMNYQLDGEDACKVIAKFQAEGYGYADYPGETGYGISLTSQRWIESELKEVGLKTVYFAEHHWDDHQDVYGVQRLRTHSG